jgi:electron transfer flavoprotein beta subunit
VFHASDRTDAGHRRYHADVLRRVGFIRVAQRVGLRLEDIKVALAMGADEAVVIDDPGLAAPDQAAVAAALAAAVKKIGACDLLLFGEGSSDNYTGQVGARVAELLGLPQIGYARKVEAKESVVRCERSMDDMIETLEAPLPAVVTVVSEANEPRIPGLMQIMKAKSKPLQVWSAADLGLDAPAPVREIVSNLAEEQDRKHILFDGSAAEQADAFVNALIKEGVLGR